MQKLLYIIVLLGLFGCGQTDLTQLHRQQDQNVQVVQALFAHFNQHDWAAMAALYSENAGFKDPAFGFKEIKMSREQLMAHYAGLAKIYPDMRNDVANIYPSGQRHVVVEFVATGTDAAGQTFEMPICTIFSVVNQKIVADYSYYNEPCVDEAAALNHGR